MQIETTTSVKPVASDHMHFVLPMVCDAINHLQHWRWVGKLIAVSIHCLVDPNSGIERWREQNGHLHPQDDRQIIFHEYE